MVIIGFRITALNGFRDEAIAFIQQVCLLEDVSIAVNLVDSLKYNIFAHNLTEALLNAQPFSTVPVYSTPDVTCISNVNFDVSMSYYDHLGNLKFYTLEPTEVVNITHAIRYQIRHLIAAKYVRCIPPINGEFSLVADYTAFDYSPQDYFAE